jgi:predicted nucleotide-binding protein
MFERFTDRARRMIVLAQEEARLLEHAYIGTEHMLLGLLHEGEGLAAQALAACDVHLHPARAEVVKIVGQGTGAPSGHIPFTVPAKKVLERARRDALQPGHNYIGTEHVLLGLLAGEDGTAVAVLVALEAQPEQVRAEVLQLVRELAVAGPPLTAVEAGEGTVFVVPGEAAARRDEIVQAVLDLTGRAPVVLHRRPGTRSVLAELFEEHGGHPRAAVVVLGADDVGGAPADLRPHARQEVIYELGWFHARLGRHGVVVLVEEGVETPGDIGVPYVTLDPQGAWRARLAAGLRAAGLRTDPDPGRPA